MKIVKLDISKFQNILVGLSAHADFMGQDNHYFGNENIQYRIIRKNTAVKIAHLIDLDSDMRSLELRNIMKEEHNSLSNIDCDFFYFDTTEGGE